MKKRFFLSILTCAIALLPTGPSFAQSSPIGFLSEFTGELVMLTQGTWENEAMAGMPIFSGDKLVITNGRAQLSFNDDTRVIICKNSILGVKQWTQKGLPMLRSALTRRRFTLMTGKFWIDTDYNNIRTEVATPSLVAGLRGDDGTTRVCATISIDQKGENHLSFDEGDRGFVIGEWDIGVTKNVPLLRAKARILIIATAQARTSVLNAKRADLSAADLEISEPTKALAWARAAKASATEARLTAQYLLLWNPDRQIRSDAKDALKIANSQMKKAKKCEQDALAAGASEEEFKKVVKLEAQEKERSVALTGLEIKEIGEPEILGDSSKPIKDLEDFHAPAPGAFADMDPCR